jgi:crotonobetainyl-CoA:carnitine CoA-transferase CaiB-like acyl-CoA transferase
MNGATGAKSISNDGPLKGVRVLDFTRFYSGPFSTLMLAGFGAEIIRIDEPMRGDPTMSGPPLLGDDGVSLMRQGENDLGLAYLKRCRGKKSITLNLRTEEGLELFRDLLRRSDVLVENLRPGAAERLGVHYEANRLVNPKIVHCALTGYGSTGQDRKLKAYDLMIQAASGLMSITGEPDGGPSKAGTALADGISGIFAASAVIAALFEQRQSGQGQFVDVSMTDVMLSLVLDEPLDCYERLQQAPRQGNRIMRFSPFNTYATKDGTVAIGAATDEDWRTLLDAMGRQELANDANFMSMGWRVANNEEVDAVVGEWAGGLTTSAAIERLNKADIAASPVRDIHDLLKWDHLRQRDMLQPITHPSISPSHEVVGAGFPLKFSRTQKGYQTPAPLLGEHNSEIYSGLLGLSPTRMERLRASSVI